MYPRQLTEKLPALSGCKASYFPLLDPPFALQTADAMAGPETTDAPVPPLSLTPAPNATPVPDFARSTAPGEEPKSAPFTTHAASPAVPRPAYPTIHIGMPPNPGSPEDPATNKGPGVIGQDQKQKHPQQQQRPQEDPQQQQDSKQQKGPQQQQDSQAQQQQGNQEQSNPTNPLLPYKDPTNPIQNPSSQDPVTNSPSHIPDFPSNPISQQPDFQPQASAVPPPAPSPIITIGTTPLTLNPTAIRLSPDRTLSAGGPAIAVAGTTLSLHSAGKLIIGTSTTNLVPSKGAQVPTQGFQGPDPLKALSSFTVVLDVTSGSGQAGEHGHMVTVEAGGEGGGGVVDGSYIGCFMTLGAMSHINHCNQHGTLIEIPY